MRTFLKAAAIAGLAWLAGVSLAAAANAAFSLPNVQYVFPLPDGFCEPTGDYDVNAKMVAQADHTNLTDLTFYRCDDMASGSDDLAGWGIVKTPLSLVSTAVSRQELIDTMKAQVDPANLKAIDEESARVATQGLKDTFGDVPNQVLDLKPLDFDANAVYMGGTTGSAEARVAAVYATTSVKDRVLILYLFRPYKDARDITGLLAQVKTLTAAFIAANGG